MSNFIVIQYCKVFLIKTEKVSIEGNTVVKNFFNKLFQHWRELTQHVEKNVVKVFNGCFNKVAIIVEVSLQLLRFRTAKI